ncbi:MAG: acyl-CoA dehydrogenase family protein [Chloroflexi bacterium]|nr:acyl-CoA dehydrogenase family protein [Chloroflexota bacterium]MCI0819832.1 acyl-CoA dehydrogenase family protein [Chloroflexota bacterium]MCI0832016.1 acyl-CoA dehydrogenase family protein [Chloroflexota bacterium]MCI0839142.1 acyl-CoA dehydrogenase family protein [Chloroflexota bacterium]
MDFDIPEDVQQLLKDLDDFIDAEIKPLEEENDNIRFFDFRREWARTDFENGGVPRKEWEDLLAEMRRRADRAGFLRYGIPAAYGGRDGSNLGMAIVREHLAAKGLGLHNDLQNESSIVGNFPTVKMWERYGTEEQKKQFLEGMFTGETRVAFGLTEPEHGSDASWLETKAVRDGDEWVINGRKRFNSGMHSATHDMIFARTSGDEGRAKGISCFVVPTQTEGFSVDFMWWTFNMPTDHAEVTLSDVRVPLSAMLGDEGDGLALANTFTHENRIRQAASGVGAAQYCIDRSVAYAKERTTFGQPLSTRQAIQWPLVELQTECEMVRQLVRKTACELDQVHHMEISDKVAMCNYRANRLVCNAADQAMQVHGGMGYTRHLPFEHIYRHHRRYRITEGSEEIQIRRIAQVMFGFGRPRD